MLKTRLSLSICIPTCNRVKTLEKTLSSILYQLDPSSDSVIISDNFSQDQTVAFVKNLQNKFPFIIYHRWQQAVEAGLNLMKSVELSQSDFCWLLTDDDILENGAIPKVKEILYHYPFISGISVNAKGYDKRLEKEKKIRFKHSIKGSQYFINSEECLKHLGAWVGFWSAQIVKKSLWDEAIKDKMYKNFLGYHHLYLIAKIIKAHNQWYFLSDRYVGYRANNESFKNEYGCIKRYEIDASTYLNIYSNFFGRSSCVTRAVCQKVIKYYLFWQLISLKCEGLNLKRHYQLFCVSWRNFSGNYLFWTRIMPLLLTPKSILRCIRKIYRKYA